MRDQLPANNGTLLHEVIHQGLFERGEPAGHSSEGWRREIVCLNLLLTSVEIWAGASKTAHRGGKVVHINATRAASHGLA
jgi:hypothetical protein